jgi:hypothetical protein
VGCGAVVGILISTAVHFPALVRPLLAAVSGAPTDRDPTPMRKYDPTARLRGWRTLAAEVDAIRTRVRAETGEEPYVAGTVWNVPGELGAYCQGHPETYSFGLKMADRHSQYDIWHPNPIADAQAFRGRSFVFVGDGLPKEQKAFDRVEHAKTVIYREEGRPVAVWWVWIGYGFRAFPEEAYYSTGKRW